MNSPKPMTAIVGGGLAGLAAAVRLTKAGHPVTLIEATKHGGGRARSYEDRHFGQEIDNGQHLMIGAYREMQSFFKAIGSDPDGIRYQRTLEVHMARAGGGRVDLKCPRLPAPLHLGAGLLRMKGLGLLHRAAALRAGIVLRGELARPDDNETCDQWLRRMGQTAQIRHAFWEPFIWAVLNDDPLVASAAMLVAVLDRAFMGSRDASALGLPTRPLSQLYVPQSLDLLQSKGATLRLGEPAREIVLDEQGAVRGVGLKGGELIEAAQVITAVPPGALLDLLPESVRQDPVFRDVARLSPSPIVNLWAEVEHSPFPDVSFVGLIQSPIHWVFDRNKLEGVHTRNHKTLLSVTISGARGFVNDSSDALKQLFESEMNRFFPDRPVKVGAFRAIKEKRATISHAAGTYQYRPAAKSPVPGLLLAGDWVQTGIPATIESAVQSGHDAARLAAKA